MFYFDSFELSYCLIYEARIEVAKNLISNFEAGEHSSISSSASPIFSEPVLSIDFLFF